MTASMSWELDREHEEFRASVRALVDRQFPGCYCTNDEAVLDADGHLWVRGRADDVINVAAHRISTLGIEAIATSHPQVAEAAVVGVSDMEDLARLQAVQQAVAAEAVPTA